MIEFISHLRKDNSLGTVCGEGWQPWQEPFNADLQGHKVVSGPIRQPRPRDIVRFCGACSRASRSQ